MRSFTQNTFNYKSKSTQNNFKIAMQMVFTYIKSFNLHFLEVVAVLLIFLNQFFQIKILFISKNPNDNKSSLF